MEVENKFVHLQAFIMRALVKACARFLQSALRPLLVGGTSGKEERKSGLGLLPSGRQWSVLPALIGWGPTAHLPPTRSVEPGVEEVAPAAVSGARGLPPHGSEQGGKLSL